MSAENGLLKTEAVSGEVVERRPAVIPPKVAIRGGQLTPDDMDGLWRIAQMYSKAGVGPQVGPYRDRRKLTPEEMFTVLSFGMAAGLSLPSALNNVYLINDKPQIFGDGVPSLLLASGKVLYRDGYTGEGNDLTAWAELIRLDASGNPIKMPDGSVFSIRREFSMQDALRAELLSKPGPWSQYTKRMLLMRARAWAARDGAADILQGLGIVEEAEDIPPPPRPRSADLSAAQAAVRAVAEEAAGKTTRPAELPEPPPPPIEFADPPHADEAVVGDVTAGMEAENAKREAKKAAAEPVSVESVQKWRESRGKGRQIAAGGAA